MARQVVSLIARTSAAAPGAENVRVPAVEDQVPAAVVDEAGGNQGNGDGERAGGAGAGTPAAGGAGAGAGDGAGGEAAPRGVFLTAESLTFPGATIVVTTLLALVNVSVPGAATSVLWALGISLVIGIVIIVLGMPPKSTTDSRQQFGFIAVGVINILLLTASALGINAYTQSQPVSITPDQVASDTP